MSDIHSLDIPRNSTLPPVHLPPAFNQPHPMYNDTKQMTAEEQREFAERLQRQLSQISGMTGASSALLGYRGGPVMYGNGGGPVVDDYPEVELRRPEVNLGAAFNSKFSKAFIDNMDFEFVSCFQEVEHYWWLYNKQVHLLPYSSSS